MYQILSLKRRSSPAIVMGLLALVSMACDDHGRNFFFSQNPGSPPSPERNVVNTADDSFDESSSQLYADLLGKYVDTSNEDHFVRYRAWTQSPKDREELLRLTQEIAQQDLDSFSDDSERLAFLINAYNILTLHLFINLGAKDSNNDGIADQNFYQLLPSPKSITRITYDVLGLPESDTNSPWNHFRFVVAGTRYTLNQLEHGAPNLKSNEYVRGFGDPRIHFAVNCASVGCPPLLGEPFEASRLDKQLDRVSIEFVNNGRDTQLDFNDQGTLKIKTSQILSWFSEDWDLWQKIENGTRYLGRSGFFAYYLDPIRHPNVSRNELSRRPLFIVDGSYDWDLNESDTPVPGTSH